MLITKSSVVHMAWFLKFSLFEIDIKSSNQHMKGTTI
jgi:hypothetical protein